MTDFLSTRLLLSLFTGGIMAVGMYTEQRKTPSVLAKESRKPQIWPLQLSTILLFWIVLGTALSQMEMVLGILAVIFLEIGIYYSLLLPLLPLLRKVYRASTVAMLWTLPNVLYLYFNFGLRQPRPWKVIVLPISIDRVFPIVWVAGFVIVMGTAIVRHAIFRNRLLRHSIPITDGNVLSVWGREKEAMGFTDAQLPLVCSTETATPLSVGLIVKTTVVILPQRTYTPEELVLLFHHELIHISRGDSATKFFLTLCQAVCWFNPLMWVAMRKCADDLELGCDELVLQDKGQGERTRYASLVLRTAGEEAGFTTCLSVSGKALRYRLKGITQYRQKSVGGVTTGVIVALLTMAMGMVAVAYSPATLEKTVFGGDSTAYVLTAVQTQDDPQWFPNRYDSYHCSDPAALRRDMAERVAYSITGQFRGSKDERSFVLTFEKDGETVRIDCCGNYINVWQGEDDKTTQERFLYLPDPPDWQYLQELLQPEDNL